MLTMNIDVILNVLQVIFAAVIVVLVLMQQQDSGFYANVTNIHRTRRGPEKLIYNLTILFGTLFVLISIVNFLA